MSASKSAWLLAIGLLLPITVHATAVSFGMLSSNDDGITAVIKDDLNHVEWLRWNYLTNLTYAQTRAAVLSGGAYEGWSIAGITDAQRFVDALLYGRTNGCTITGTLTETCADGPLPDLTPLLGDNFNRSEDNKFFLSNNGGGAEVGILGYYRESVFDVVRKQNDWDSIARSDELVSSGPLSSAGIGWLLYRSVPVSAPPTAVVLLVGLAAQGAVAALSRRRRSVAHDRAIAQGHISEDR